MPVLYLSPSTQEYNPYIIGGNEEEYMNLLADGMEPYLYSTGIRVVRNERSDTLDDIVEKSNAQRYALHLALHSNAAPPSLAGRLRGTEVYYYPTSVLGRRAAEIIASHFRSIALNPDLVRALPTTTLVELNRTRAPAVLIEIAYHDNPLEATWIADNLQVIARNLAQSVAMDFHLPFIEAQMPRPGRVSVHSGVLNIRSRPSRDAAVLTTAPNGAAMQIRGEWQSWYVVEYEDVIGYASAQYVQV
ncbi:MAG: N-acetylmuramoyl-L-alanine amidase [Acutalibacteraceae bacterium]|jgi:N-acetylmuramoyl-L-alanine amidase